MKLYRIVDENGNIVSGINRDVDHYVTISGARSAKTQLDGFLYPRELTIEEADVGEFR